ncbi:MAG: hypothetical protein HKN67_07770 [Saprospiraceae bacterium]|nr:hypothetical protein [Bacteroidia bacterium]MBT8230856.1 hypothetical protein [Bacteroidia bacterium]NNF21823.1 hypothetical protein [Saprospiraceae bacterium]NNK90245.1 hypothetical protein [Saprospiraceae bacterium]
MFLKILILHLSLSGFYFNTNIPAERIIRLDSAGLKISFFGQDDSLFESIEFDHNKGQLKFKLRKEPLFPINGKTPNQVLSNSVDSRILLILEKNFGKGYQKYNLNKENQAESVYISVVRE